MFSVKWMRPARLNLLQPLWAVLSTTSNPTAARIRLKFSRCFRSSHNRAERTSSWAGYSRSGLEAFDRVSPSQQLSPLAAISLPSARLSVC